MRKKIGFIILIVSFSLATLTNLTFNLSFLEDFSLNSIEFALASSGEGSSSGGGSSSMSCNCSGGPGSSSCACNSGIASIESGCSVTCNSGYYACCSNYDRCHCIKL